MFLCMLYNVFLFLIHYSFFCYFLLAPDDWVVYAIYETNSSAIKENNKKLVSISSLNFFSLTRVIEFYLHSVYKAFLYLEALPSRYLALGHWPSYYTSFFVVFFYCTTISFIDSVNYPINNQQINQSTKKLV